MGSNVGVEPAEQVGRETRFSPSSFCRRWTVSPWELPRSETRGSRPWNPQRVAAEGEDGERKAEDRREMRDGRRGEKKWSEHRTSNIQHSKPSRHGACQPEDGCQRADHRLRSTRPRTGIEQLNTEATKTGSVQFAFCPKRIGTPGNRWFCGQDASQHVLEKTWRLRGFAVECQLRNTSVLLRRGVNRDRRLGDKLWPGSRWAAQPETQPPQRYQAGY